MKIIDLYPAGTNPEDILEQLRTDYQAVCSAIRELVAGEQVVAITISGKITRFHDTDLEELRRMKSEYSVEIGDLMAEIQGSSGKAYVATTSKGL